MKQLALIWLVYLVTIFAKNRNWDGGGVAIYHRSILNVID